MSSFYRSSPPNGAGRAFHSSFSDEGPYHHHHHSQSGSSSHHRSTGGGGERRHHSGGEYSPSPASSSSPKHWPHRRQGHSQSPPTVQQQLNRANNVTGLSHSPPLPDWRLAATNSRPYCGPKFLMSPPAKALPMPPQEWLAAKKQTEAAESPKKPLPIVESSPQKQVEQVSIYGEVARLFRCSELLIPVENAQNLRKATGQPITPVFA